MVLDDYKAADKIFSDMLEIFSSSLEEIFAMKALSSSKLGLEEKSLGFIMAEKVDYILSFKVRRAFNEFSSESKITSQYILIIYISVL